MIANLGQTRTLLRATVKQVRGLIEKRSKNTNNYAQTERKTVNRVNDRFIHRISVASNVIRARLTPKIRFDVTEMLLIIKELCHDILSHFCELQNHFQTEESLKIIVY